VSTARYGCARRRYRSPYGRRSSGSALPAAAIAGVVLLAGAGAGAKAAHRAPPAAAGVAAVRNSAPVTGTAAANTALGKAMASSRGWGSGPQWTCLDELWTRESGWLMVWNYQGSGAYGIPQALPAGQMASAGADYMTDPATQVRWGLGYIASRYGTPCGAWNHEEAVSWY
jgi:resuscitation-promoting factor RpfB